MLVGIFLLNVDAAPGTYVPSGNVLRDTADSSISVPVDSSSIVKPDSVAAVNEEIATSVKAKTLTGIASFYSKSLEGTKTATGETFRHANYTAASNNLPLNTWVRVTNLKTGKSCIVRINDRMHPKMAKKGRVVDLTITAARKIGLTSRIGITKVSLEVIPKDTPDLLSKTEQASK